MFCRAKGHKKINEYIPKIFVVVVLLNTTQLVIVSTDIITDKINYYKVRKLNIFNVQITHLVQNLNK